MTVYVVENLNNESWADDHILGVFYNKKDAIQKAENEIEDRHLSISEKYLWQNGDIDWYIEGMDEAKITITQCIIDAF